MDAALRSLLDWYAQVGVDVPQIALPRAIKKRVVKTQQTRTQPNTSQPVQRAASAPRKDAPRPNTDIIKAAQSAAAKAKTLDELNTALTGFDAGPLSDNARGAVLGTGNANAKLMVIGESASREDDIEGKPFSGPDGQLLTRILGAIGLSSSAGAQDYYAALTLPWRGATGRTASEADIAIGLPFLRRAIELIAPDHLVLFGSTPMRALMGATSIMKHHGQWQDVTIGGRTIPAITIYHPALLRRQPDLKKEAWRDLLSLRAAILGEINPK